MANLSRTKRTKHQVCDSYLQNLLARPDISYLEAGFAERLRSHFELLPTRYALDINIESLDVLNHMQLLEEARRDPSAVFFHVRTVEVLVNSHSRQDVRSTSGSVDAPAPMDTQEQDPAGAVSIPASGQGPGAHSQSPSARLPSPAFGSSPNLQALALDALEADTAVEARQFHEITVVSADQPKLLSRLSEVMGDLGLNICEAHAFNSTDKFSLDIFVVDGWSSQAKEGLEQALSARFAQLTPAEDASPPAPAGPSQPTALLEHQLQRANFPLATALAGQDFAGMEDWEVDINQLDIESKIAQGSFGTLYKGYYCGQEVAVKILRDVQEDPQQYQEFLQEVSIMRKVRHKNVVQFIGACTRQPNFCILFEYMAGGSVYDYVRRHGLFRLTKVLEMLHQIARGMDYLHQRGIIHRDLKAANLLLDENLQVKIADFGVARLMEKDTIMTAETGTYRWMAPEVIEHKDYNQKADVFSFGIVVWELLTGLVPYAECTALQAAVGVVQKGLRPTMPPGVPTGLAQLVQSCWHSNPDCRPAFKDLVPVLETMWREAKNADAAAVVIEGDAAMAAPQPSRSFFSRLRPGKPTS